MDFEISLNKMSTEIGNPVKYYLFSAEKKIFMNDLLNRNIEIIYSGEIYCIKCGRKTNKSFSQGYCYPCFTIAPETEECVLRPELCQAHMGIARDMDYAREHCLHDHVVYLAASSDIKVGITRIAQVPFRWIDQGASSAMRIALTPNRFIAGLMEVSIKKQMPDKTNWRLMLTNKIISNPDYESAKDAVSSILPEELKKYLLQNEPIIYIEYPVFLYPQKISTIELEKVQIFKGVLKGIKGQYLIFENGKVINIRKYSGYKVRIKTMPETLL
jgi:hypothetical protein